MLGLLLIIWKNGRSVKTYGVNRVRLYNMKFTFLCIVTVASCSVCASGDLDIYPGLKFRLNEDERSRLDNLEDPSFTDYKRYEWRNAPLEDFGENDRKLPEYDLTLPETIRQFEEVIDWEKAQLNRHGSYRAHHENPKHRYDFVDAYRRFMDPKEPNNFNYKLGIPNTPVLDEVRMYPQEDDFSFKTDEDEEEDGIQKFYSGPTLEEQEALFQENLKSSLNKIRSSDSGSRDYASHHKHDKTTAVEGFPSGTFRNVKVVDDPTEFAYAPPDPRFYVKSETTAKSGVEIQQSKPGISDAEFEVKQRNDQKVTQAQDEETTEKDNYSELAHRTGSVDVVAVKPNSSDVDSAGVYIIAIVAGISAAATVGLIAVGIGWYNLQKHVKNASDVEYPAYGVTGPNKDISPSGDRRLAQSAQMYHYQHQKQQIIAMERAPPGDRHGSLSEAESDEENEEGDYTVYECPGLAPTGEMEVKNPLFLDDPTPAQTPAALKATNETK